MEVRSNFSQNFGAIHIDPSARPVFLDRITSKEFSKFVKLSEQQKANPFDVFVYKSTNDSRDKGLSFVLRYFDKHFKKYKNLISPISEDLLQEKCFSPFSSLKRICEIADENKKTYDSIMKKFNKR